MAKNQVFIDIIIDDKGTTKRVAVDAGKLGIELEKSAKASEKGAKGTEKLSKSQKNLDRNMRGTAKMSSNTTKEFSKMSQGMGGLVGAYATLAAQVFAVSAAFQFLSNASDFRNLVRGQEALGAATGTTYKTISNAIVEATDAQLKYADAAKGAAIGTAAGLQSGQLEKLAEAAKNTSFALGRDLTDSYNRLIRGVTKAEPELLDELGIILRLAPASEKYARSIGKTAGELNAFERTQAVANEVLEQAERKFGAIGAQMDPSSLALSRFTKSFDELVNTFKVGLIDVLSPVFSFLSKNTYALSAAMALFALPIIKAIIPNLNAWANSQQKVYDEHQAHSENFKKDMKSQAETVFKSNKSMQKVQAETADKARKTAEKMGTKGSGIDYITGKDKSNKGKLGAGSMLTGARAQMDKEGKITTGKLAGYNKAQLADLERSYKARVAAAKTAAQQIVTIWQRAGAGVKAVALGVQSAWAKAMGGMVAAARVAAVAVNVAMATIAFVGVLVMLYAIGKAIIDYFFPISDHLKKQQEQVTSLTDRYKTLNEEMGRSQKNRINLVGTESIQSKGASLQGLDMQKTLKELNAFQGLDPNTSGYGDLKKELEGTFKSLTKINPEFRKVEQAFKNGTKVSSRLTNSLIDTSNKMIELGNEMRNLPTLLREADVAFTALGKSLVTETPLSKFVDIEARAVAGLQKNDEQIRKALMESQNTSAFATELRQKQVKTEARLGATAMRMITIYKKLGLDRMAALVFSEHGATDYTQEDGYLSEEAEKSANKARTEGFNVLVEDGKELRKRTELLKAANDLEQKIIGNRIIQNQHMQEATALQTQGLSLEGQINNLEIKRVQEANKILKAEEAVQTAQFAMRGLEGDKLKTAEENFILAGKDLELTLLQVNLQNLITDSKEDQLVLTIARLEAEKGLIMSQEKLRDLKDELSRDKANSGTTRADKGRFRGKNRDILAQARDASVLASNLAIEKFDEKLANVIQEMAGTHADTFRDGTAFGDKVADYQLFLAANGMQDIGKDVAKRADLQMVGSTFGKNVNTTNRDKTNAQNELTDFDSEYGIEGSRLTNSLPAEREKLALQAEGLVLGRGRQETARLIAQYEADGVAATPAVIARYEEEGQALAQQKTLLEGIANIRDTISNSMATAFQGLIEGTKTAKQAFGDMAKSILSAIAQMIAKLLVVKILGASMFGGMFDSILPSSSKDGGIPHPMAKGGYSLNKHNYSRGGTARGASAGYAATLHGNEAVVPLPDNRSIPVTLNGAGGQNNNVVVNVSMDGQGGAQQNSQGDSNMAANIGKMVAGAVQEELQYQKRSGGILNPYGAA